MSFPFVKGHGTSNDFVVLPDLDGSVHGDLEPHVVAALCDRRAGIGADGVLRVLHGDVDGGAEWFMDYRNADGSVSEMCGNGIRVFARYLADSGLVDAESLDGPLAIDTRDGIKLATFCDDGEISVDMGTPKVAGEVTVSVDGAVRSGRKVDMGNPHAVVLVDALADAGELRQPSDLRRRRVPRRRQRRVRRDPRPTPRRDAGLRARRGRDLVVRHRRVRRRGRGGGRRGRARGAGRPGWTSRRRTPSTSTAARSPSPGGATTTST